MKNVRIFLSYSSHDANEARSIAERMLSLGIAVWFAEYDVLSSTYDALDAALDDNLKKAIASCTHAALLVTESWEKSDYCVREAAYIRIHRETAGLRAVCVCPVSRPQPNVAEIRSLPVVQFDRNTPQAVVPDILHALNLLAPTENPPSGDVVFDGRRFVFRYGEINLGPFQPRELPSHYDEVAREHLYYFSSTFENSRMHFDINVNPCRTAVTPLGSTLPESALVKDQGRDIYRQLRQRAKPWYEQTAQDEKGLHLFWWRGHSEMALTHVSRYDAPGHLWKRVYVLLVKDPVTGNVAEVDLTFEVHFADSDPSLTFCSFARTIPWFDQIAQSFQYHGDRTQPVRPSWGVTVAVFAAAGLIGVTLGHLFLTTRFPDPWGAVIGGSIGLLLLGPAWRDMLTKRRIGPPRSCCEEPTEI